LKNFFGKKRRKMPSRTDTKKGGGDRDLGSSFTKNVYIRKNLILSLNGPVKGWATFLVHGKGGWEESGTVLGFRTGKGV